MTNNISMRDSFFNKLYTLAQRDSNIVVISADMGAPGLDKFRADLKSQFVNVGIAEANMVTVATGLALCGKKVFIYAIMPFVTSRCYEMLKVDLSLMNIGVNIVGVGAGFSYDESGPTHHCTEDVTIMRALPNLTILSPSDSVMTGAFAGMACDIPGPCYIRLDRKVFEQIYDKKYDFSDGLSCLREGRDVCIVATGNMVHYALECSRRLERDSIGAGVIDLYRLKPINKSILLENVRKSRKIVTLEEHLRAGGVGSAVTEILADNECSIPVKRIGIHDKYCYTYGGRENIQSQHGLDVQGIHKTVLDWAKRTGRTNEKELEDIHYRRK